MRALPIPVEDLLCVRARDDFGTFLELTFTTLNPKVELARGWYLSAMLQALNEIADGSNRRLQITVPPRHLKSIMTTVAFSAWMMGRDPTCKIICASYGQELASSLSRDFRKVITSEWYKRVFPVTATSIDRETENEVRTKQGGFRFATAVGSAVTGYGADLIIIDDLLKAADASYPEARARAQRFVDESLFTNDPLQADQWPKPRPPDRYDAAAPVVRCLESLSPSEPERGQDLPRDGRRERPALQRQSDA
jgi:hypothetical protein